MLSFGPQTQIYLVSGFTDMRKAYDGLAAIVQEALGKSATGGQIFVFCNRRRDRIKILLWERGGFWLIARRLERGTFHWPRIPEPSLELSHEQLVLLLGGIDLSQTRPRRWYRAA